MKTLILETSTEKSLVALGVSGKVLIEKSLLGGPELSKRLALEVKELLDCHSFQPERIAVGQGPGSYTGIRVGAALAKALAFGWKVPLVGFCSLQAFLPPVEGPFASLIDARSGGIYVLRGVKVADSYSFDQPELIPLSEVRIRLKGIPHFCSPHPDQIRERVGLEGAWFEVEPDAAHLVKWAEERVAEGEISMIYLSNPE